MGPTPSEPVEKRPQNGCYSCQWNCVTYLAHGLIFSARPRLIQNPAPPVANQNLVDILKVKKDKTSLYYPFFFTIFFTWSKHRQTHRAVIFDPLSSFNWMIQAGTAQVDVLAVVVWGEQMQQARKNHVVIVIHVAKPPEGQTKNNSTFLYTSLWIINTFNLCFCMNYSTECFLNDTVGLLLLEANTEPQYRVSTAADL